MDAEITIGRGQWFSDVIPVFNPNTIYNKWITGIGGTTTAINDGYTIIISPNVAGIVSKEGIENVVAVYGGIDSQRNYSTFKIFYIGIIICISKIFSSPRM